jgi:hypothetical protein
MKKSVRLSLHSIINGTHNASFQLTPNKPSCVIDWETQRREQEQDREAHGGRKDVLLTHEDVDRESGCGGKNGRQNHDEQRTRPNGELLSKKMNLPLSSLCDSLFIVRFVVVEFRYLDLRAMQGKERYVVVSRLSSDQTRC